NSGRAPGGPFLEIALRALAQSHLFGQEGFSCSAESRSLDWREVLQASGHNPPQDFQDRREGACGGECLPCGEGPLGSQYSAPITSACELQSGIASTPPGPHSQKHAMTGSLTPGPTRFASCARPGAESPICKSPI